MRNILLALALACGGVQTGWATTADDIRSLVEQGRSAEAYALGQKHPEDLGKAEFDFFYGIAAIDAGHAGEGVLALERYVVQFPDNDRARLELARGYFVLGELLRAREEFENVSRKNPPPSVQATIDRFMDSIRAQETRYKTSSSFYVEAGVGYDTNVNSGAANAVIDVPTLGTVQLTPAGVKSAGGFAHLAAGANVTHPVAPGVSLIGGLSYEGKDHSSDFNRQFDLQTLGGYGGFSVVKDRDLWRASASLSSLTVGTVRFRDMGSLGGEWHRQVDELNTFSLFGQAARLNYLQTPVRNSDFYAIGAGWRRAFVGKMQPVLQLQALLGNEQNGAAPVRNDLSRHLVTLRAGLSITPAPKWGASVGLNYTPSRYRDNDIFANVKRSDDYYGLDATLSYRWTRAASVRVEYLYSDNRSNIALYQYNREVLALKLRYDFQ